MKRIFYIIAALLVLAGCNRGQSHIVVPGVPEPDKGGAVVELDVAHLGDVKLTDTHIYGFDHLQKLIYHAYYPTQELLSKEAFSLGAGSYTFVAVLNMGKDFMPNISDRMRSNSDAGKADGEQLPEITLGALLRHLKIIKDDYPDMLTGMIQQQVNPGELSHLTIPIEIGVNGLIESQLKLTLTLPDAQFGEYQASRVRTTAPYNLRGVVEFYQRGKEACVSRQTAILAATATQGVYTMDTEITHGDYDMLIWADYTQSGSVDDLYYNTASLQAIHIVATDKQYVTAGDRREVFYGKSTAIIANADQQVDVAMARPLAKYSLIAGDIARYRLLMKANPEKYPELSELNVMVNYEGYLPCGFDVGQGKPNHGDTGYKYQNQLPGINADDQSVQVASDYVIVNGAESSVSVTVTVTDRAGKKISQVKGVQIMYRPGKMTTITGDFLTAGVVNPGINIDTDWEDTHEVEF